MSISDEAVEAAARAVYGNGSCAWSAEDQHVRARFLNEARLALESALPFLAGAK